MSYDPSVKRFSTMKYSRVPRAGCMQDPHLACALDRAQLVVAGSADQPRPEPAEFQPEERAEMRAVVGVVHQAVVAGRKRVVERNTLPLPVRPAGRSTDRAGSPAGGPARGPRRRGLAAHRCTPRRSPESSRHRRRAASGWDIRVPPRPGCEPNGPFCGITIKHAELILGARRPSSGLSVERVIVELRIRKADRFRPLLHVRVDPTIVVGVVGVGRAPPVRLPDGSQETTRARPRVRT